MAQSAIAAHSVPKLTLLQSQSINNEISDLSSIYCDMFIWLGIKCLQCTWVSQIIKQSLTTNNNEVHGLWGLSVTDHPSSMP